MKGKKSSKQDPSRCWLGEKDSNQFSMKGRLRLGLCRESRFLKDLGDFGRVHAPYKHMKDYDYKQKKKCLNEEGNV